MKKKCWRQTGCGQKVKHTVIRVSGEEIKNDKEAMLEKIIKEINPSKPITSEA